MCKFCRKGWAFCTFQCVKLKNIIDFGKESRMFLTFFCTNVLLNTKKPTMLDNTAGFYDEVNVMA